MADKKRETRRQKRIAARQAQILEAAAIIFSQKGYERATTREIAAQADLAEGTLYNYFDGKRDILLAWTERIIGETAGIINRVQADSLLDLARQALQARFEMSKQHRMLLTFLHEARLDADLLQVYQERLQREVIQAAATQMKLLVEAGVMRPVNLQVAARALLAITLGFGVQYELGEDPFLAEMPPAELAADVTDLLFFGLQAQVVPALEMERING